MTTRGDILSLDLHEGGNQPLYPGFGQVLRVIEAAGVLAASCASGPAVNRGRMGTVFDSKDGSNVSFRVAPIDYDFLSLLDIKLLAGRLFASNRGEDDLLRADPETQSNPSIVLNETGARTLGFASPQAAVGQSVRWSRIISRGKEFKAADSASSQIIGVVPDAGLGSVRDAIEATAGHTRAAQLSFQA